MATKIMKPKKDLKNLLVLIVISVGIFSLLNLSFASATDPQGPDTLTKLFNSTKGSVAAKQINLSGGYIALANLSATIQDSRWKAFVGWVTGQFTLDDANGDTIYDWTLSSTKGEIVATRNESAITWGSIGCASTANIESENNAMNHDNADDNITATFSSSSHGGYWIAGVQITENSCYSANPYINSASQSGRFNETVLYDGSSILYAVNLEEDQTGYNGTTYDFQMIVPEDGTPGFSSYTPYYLYVELD